MSDITFLFVTSVKTLETDISAKIISHFRWKSGPGWGHLTTEFSLHVVMREFRTDRYINSAVQLRKVPWVLNPRPHIVCECHFPRKGLTYTRSQNPLRKLLKTVCLALPAVLQKLSLLARLYCASKERPRTLLRSVHGHRYSDVSDFLVAFLDRHSSVPHAQ